MTDLTDLIAEYHRIQELKNLPVMTDEELEAAEFPEEQNHVTFLANYQGQASEVRVTSNRQGEKIINIDRTWAIHNLNNRIDGIAREIGERTLQNL